MPRIPIQISNCRKVFKKFKTRVEDPTNKKAAREFEKALETLIYNYNTRIYANRFIVGDAVELLLCALIKAVGLQCIISNQERTDLYIQIPNGKAGQFSVKSNFHGKGDIRLINVMGESRDVQWSEPTIFLIANKGIYYADPYMNIPIKRTADAVTIKTTHLETIKDEFKITSLKIPINPKNPISTVSPAYDVVKSILKSIKSVLLTKYL